MSKPDFLEMASEWLVRAQGRAQAKDVESLSAEFERVFDLGRLAGPTDATKDMLGKMFSYDGPAKPKR